MRFCSEDYFNFWPKGIFFWLPVLLKSSNRRRLEKNLNIHYVNFQVILISSSILHLTVPDVLYIRDRVLTSPEGEVKVLVTQWCLTLCDPMDFGPPGSSCLWSSSNRNIGVVAIPLSRWYSQPMDQAWVSCSASKFFTIWDTRDPLERVNLCHFLLDIVWK